MAGQNWRHRNVHILMMGRNPDHAVIGLKELKADKVYVITSDIYAQEYQDGERSHPGYNSMLSSWAESLGIEEGRVFAISNKDLFSPNASAVIVSVVEQVIREERGSLSTSAALDSAIRITEESGGHAVKLEGDDEETTYFEFYIGITGGTNLMAGAAVHAANIFHATPYYIARTDSPDESSVTAFGSMASTELLLTSPMEAMKELFDESFGDLYDLSDDAGMLVSNLSAMNLASTNWVVSDDPMDDPDLTYELRAEGKMLIGIMLERRGSIASAEGAAKEGRYDWMATGDPPKGELLFELFKVNSEDTGDPVRRVLMEKYNLEGRAEIWKHGDEDELTLRTYFADPSNDSFDSLERGDFDEERISGDFDELCDRILLMAPYRFDKNTIANIISGGQEVVLLSFLAKLRFTRMGFFNGKNDGSGPNPFESPF